MEGILQNCVLSCTSKLSEIQILNMENSVLLYEDLMRCVAESSNYLHHYRMRILGKHMTGYQRTFDNAIRAHEIEAHNESYWLDDELLPKSMRGKSRRACTDQAYGMPMSTDSLHRDMKYLALGIIQSVTNFVAYIIDNDHKIHQDVCKIGHWKGTPSRDR